MALTCCLAHSRAMCRFPILVSTPLPLLTPLLSVSFAIFQDASLQVSFDLLCNSQMKKLSFKEVK